MQEITRRLVKLNTFNEEEMRRERQESKEVAFLVFSDHFRGVAIVRRG